MGYLKGSGTDMAGEYQSAHQAVALLDQSGTEKWVTVEGDDAASYLHRMTSNHVENLKPGQGQHSLYLTGQGKIIAELYVHCLSKTCYALQVPLAAADTLLSRFNMFVLNSQVEIHDRDQHVVFTVCGPQSADLLGALAWPVPEAELGHTRHVVDDQPIVVIRALRPIQPSFDLVLPKSLATDLGQQLLDKASAFKGCTLSAETAEVLRLERGWPSFESELAGDVIPQEAMLERTAVSFDKGCYPGQETVAKIKYRGAPPRLLVKLEIDGETVPESGAEIRQDDKVLGVLTSAAKHPDGRVLGLGLVKRKYSSEAQSASLHSPDQEFSARLEPLQK